MLPAWASDAWTTGLFPEAERLDAWRAVAWDAFSPIAVDGAQGSFMAALAAGAIGALGLARIHASAQTVHRRREHVAAGDPGVFFLNLSLTGGSTVSQDGRTAELGAGDLTVVDSARPFRLDFVKRFDQISLMLPKELMLPRLRDPEVATAVVVRGSEGVGAIASGAIRGAGGARGGGGHALREHGASDAIMRLIALAVDEAVADAGREPTLLDRVKAEAEGAIADPDLGPAEVAARVGVSTRYLHKLFAATATSFGRWLLAVRLERCRRVLLDPASAPLTIAEIALGHGLRDPSYFARAYKARYGMAPAQTRALASKL